MEANLKPGDFLIFQLEAAYGLLRLLDVEEGPQGRIWHVSAYGEFFPDVESAESAIQSPNSLTVSNPHIAMTTRAFESTQVAKLDNLPLSEPELENLIQWRNDPDRVTTDRSVRLMLGLR
jgi:hypothetical protein